MVGELALEKSWGYERSWLCCCFYMQVCSILNWTLASRRGALEKEWRGAVLQQASKSVLDIGREQASSVREPYTCLEEIEWEIQAKRKERNLKKIKERRMIILDVASDSGLMHPEEFSPVKTKQNSAYPSLTTLQSKQKLFKAKI